MKRRDLERHLRDCGCQPIREGANHAIWANPPLDLRAPVPRHREIPTGTARDLTRRAPGQRPHRRSKTDSDVCGRRVEEWLSELR